MLVKFTKEEHNLALGCSTLQLGTFNYYRALDPTFTIADPDEGVLEITGPEEPIEVDAATMNAISGGAVTFHDSTTTGSAIATVAGDVEYVDSDSSIIFDDGVMTAQIGPGLKIRLKYPNCFIFCVAQIDDVQAADPSSVAPDYDSFYVLKQDQIDNFVQEVSGRLGQQLRMRDVRTDGQQTKTLASAFSPIKIECVHRLVEYVDDKALRVRRPEDISQNGVMNRYIESAFTKSTEYAHEQEYRFLFVVQNQAGIIAMQDDPIVLDMKPIAALLSSGTRQVT